MRLMRLAEPSGVYSPLAAGRFRLQCAWLVSSAGRGSTLQQVFENKRSIEIGA